MAEHECGEVGLALMEDNCDNMFGDILVELEDPTEAKVPKPVMISMKEQLRRDKFRMQVKQGMRMKKNPRVQVPVINTGNKDHGIPYTGKDKFGGMFRKFDDRIMRDYVMEDGRVVNRLFVLSNNKYNTDGTLKD